MQPEAATSSDDPGLLENVCLVRFAYHLWRVDTAARALPKDPSIPDIDIMKARWEIGLVLELVSVSVKVHCHINDVTPTRRICADILQMHVCWVL